MFIRLEGDAVAEWREHWLVVLASSAGVTISTINVYSAGLFFQPLQHAFGWSRAQISFGALIPAVVTALLAVPMGAAIDRLGPRRIGLFGIIALCAITAMLGSVGPSIYSWWAIWTLLAMINVFIMPTVWSAAVAGFFTRSRGLAFAVTLSGSGLGSLTTPFVTYELIAHVGWRLAFVGLAAFWAVVVIPIVALFFTSRTDRARMAGAWEHAPPPQHEWRVRASPQALATLRSRRFLQLALAAALIATVVVSFAVSVVPVLIWTGLSRGQAAGIATLLGLASIAGRLSIGALLDRIDGRILCAVSVCLPIIASLLLILLPGIFPAAVAATLILGLALGTELDLVAYLTSRYFALEHFGLLFGTIGGLIAVASAAGPWLMSLVYDSNHSYLAALWTAIPMCFTAAILFLLLGPYPAWPRDRSSVDAA